MKQVGLRVGLSGDSFQLKIVTTIRYSCINECINSSAKFGSVCLFELLTLLTYAKKVRGWGRSRGRNPSRVVYDSTDRLLAIFTTAKSTINKPHTNASSQTPKLHRGFGEICPPSTWVMRYGHRTAWWLFPSRCKKKYIYNIIKGSTEFQ